MKSNNFFKYLTERQKLSLRNVRTGKEIWHIFVSRLNLILSFFAFVVVLFVVVLTTVAYTPILDLIPGYPGNKARRMIIENIAKLDSLEMQVREWEAYNHNLAYILEGKVIPVAGTDSIRIGTKGSVFPKSLGDSLLRLQIETDSNYMLVKEQRKKVEATFELVAPIRGAVIKAFNPKEQMFGVEITPQANQSIMSVLDGTVILTTWDPNDGYMIVVEHAANMVSMYKKISHSLCKIGQRVKAGEAIAMTGTIIDGRIPHLVFELWNNGNAVDPENYITF